MPKCVISNRIYLEVDPRLSQSIRDMLTYLIPTYGDGPPTTVRNYFMFRSDIISIPVGRTDLIPTTHEIVDKRILKPVEFPPFNGILRESQQEIYDAADDNCLINAKVGWGKTFMALALARKLGQKTLIVVHTLHLMHQWAKEIEKVFGFKPGLVGDGHENYTPDIVVGNVASLYKRIPQMGKLFGLMIMDEVHHAPAPTFSKVVDKCYARYKIGLSGTLRRKDELHVLLPDYFSSKVYTPARENTLQPIVHVYDTGITFPYGDIWANRVTELADDWHYQSLVVKLIEKYENLGHKVLIVSDRVEFLRAISVKANTALIIGETNDREEQLSRLDNHEVNSVAGTLSIWKEGISHNSLSCVILGTPINNMPMLEQLIGRIQRLAPDKVAPVVVDLTLRGHTTERQFTNRYGFYLKEGFDIKYL